MEKGKLFGGDDGMTWNEGKQQVSSSYQERVRAGLVTLVSGSGPLVPKYWSSTGNRCVESRTQTSTQLGGASGKDPKGLPPLHDTVEIRVRD